MPDSITTKGFHSFTQIPDTIFQLGLSGNEIALYAALLSHTHKGTTQAFPGYERLGAMVSLSKRSVGKYIHKLADQGLIKVERRHKKNGNRTTNLYTVIHPALAEKFSGSGGGLPEKSSGSLPEKFSSQEVQQGNNYNKKTLVAEPLGADTPPQPTRNETDEPCECEGEVNPETGRKRDVCWDAIAEAYSMPPGASGRIAVLKAYFFHKGKSRGEYAKYALDTPMTVNEFKRWAAQEKAALGDAMTKAPMKLQERVASWRAEQRKRAGKLPGRVAGEPPQAKTQPTPTLENADAHDRLALLRNKLKFASPDERAAAQAEIERIERELTP